MSKTVPVIIVVVVSILFLRSSLLHEQEETASVSTSFKSAFTLQETGQTWYEQSVLCITNQSDASFTHFQIFSASGNVLPILYIGSSPPSSMRTDGPLANPPYSVGPHESVWFADHSAAPHAEYVQWFNGVQTVGVTLYGASPSLSGKSDTVVVH